MNALQDTESTSRGAFDAWVADRRHEKSFNEESRRKYLPLWNAWLGWLSAQNRSWHEVSGSLIERFLQGPAPGTGGRRKALSPTMMTTFTKQRYWHILEGVYGTAFRLQMIHANPTMDVDGRIRPHIAPGDRKSQTLAPSQFSALQVPETIREIVPLGGESEWWYVRDRAMLAVLVETGITTAELINLKVKDVMHASRRSIVPGQLELETGGAQGLLLDVMASKEKIGRTLDLPAPMAPFVLDWLRVHWKLQPGQDQPLFLSRRPRQKDGLFPEMEAVTVYYSVSQALERLRRNLQIGATSRAAKGPAVIRNSVIQHWLDTAGEAVAMSRAGLKNSDFRRLSARVKGEQHE